MQLKVKTTLEATKLPSKREEDSGYDIYVSPTIDMIIIDPGTAVALPTDLRIEVPTGYVFKIEERGSTGTKCMAVRAGVVDSGYRGEILVVINNTSRYPIFIGTEEGYKKMGFNSQTVFHDREKAIAQGLIIKTEHFEVVRVNELSESERGEGKLGASGK
jgi:dUTP pyrophosphatase